MNEEAQTLDRGECKCLTGNEKDHILEGSDNMEYNINSKFDNIEIKNVEANISIYKLTGNADISIRYVTEEFVSDLYEKLGLKLEPRTLGGKKYYILNIHGSPTNIKFWIEPK